MTTCRIGTLLLGAALCISSAAFAQSTAGITGVARDTTGAVLPGVTVEAASPALIEKVRVATTDSQGRFNITDLRPGTYSVTFTLPGFSTYKREGIELSSGFTASANADMKVGGLEETVTVTGASPLVDIQNVRTQQVMKYETLEALPSGGRDLSQFASLTLGATSSTQGRNDVGGALVDLNTSVVVHGGRGDDSKINYDGMNTNGFWSGGGGQMRIWKFNTIAVQETVVDTGGADAETETGGANVNMIPRDGGNQFSVHSILSWANSSMASGTVPDSLVARGSAPESKSLKKVYDYGVGIGGPLMRDRLWFYNANRVWGGQAYGANNYYNKSAVFYRYEPDLSRPAYTDTWLRDFGVRLTLQATAKHKLTSGVNWQRACNCYLGISLGVRESPDGTTSYQYGSGIPGGGMWNSQTTWSYPATNKLLFLAGASFLIQTVSYTTVPFPTAPRITEQTTGYSWNSEAGGTGTDWNRPQGSNNFTQRFSISYITGSHAFKTGFQSQQGLFESWGNQLPGAINYTFRNGVPVSLTQWAAPFENQGIIRRYGLFASDQWTINRLTLNLGVRYDGWSLYTNARTVPAGPFTTDRPVPQADCLPCFKDVTPRVGVSYDVFGNGKTAIKGSWGRYLMGLGGGDAQALSPSNAIIQNTSRQWTDLNGNFVPDCDLKNLQQNGECGTVANLQFGQPTTVTSWDPSARTGWGVREYSYRYTVALQHELFTGVGLNVSYNRTDWKNQQAIVNRTFTPADFTPFCITSPTDTRLGEFGGKQVCGLYDVDPAKFGQVNAVRMLAKDVPGANGAPKEIFNGVDFSINARFGKGGVLQGGATFGRTLLDFCWLNNLPQVTQLFQPGAVANRETTTSLMPRQQGYCNIQTPWWSGVGSQVKFQAVYPLPYDISVSGTWKDIPGIALPADYVVSNTVASAAIGRDLAACRGLTGAACTATQTIALLPYGVVQGNYSAALFDDRVNEIDLRFTRTFRIARGKVQPAFEIYNITNNRPAQGIVTTYGPSYKLPFALLGGRLFKIGAQVDW